ncbi:hypothetical protein AKO1_015760, partial [Acrasis kona]
MSSVDQFLGLFNGSSSPMYDTSTSPVVSLVTSSNNETAIQISSSFATGSSSRRVLASSAKYSNVTSLRCTFRITSSSNGVNPAELWMSSNNSFIRLIFVYDTTSYLHLSVKQEALKYSGKKTYPLSLSTTYDVNMIITNIEEVLMTRIIITANGGPASTLNVPLQSAFSLSSFLNEKFSMVVSQSNYEISSLDNLERNIKSSNGSATIEIIKMSMSTSDGSSVASPNTAYSSPSVNNSTIAIIASIVGVSVGVLLFFLLFIIILGIILRKKKNKVMDDISLKESSIGSD